MSCLVVSDLMIFGVPSAVGRISAVSELSVRATEYRDSVAADS